MRNQYYLLPFRFDRIGDNEIIVNEVGDHIVAPNGTVSKIVDRKLDKESKLYKDLVANFFISPYKIDPLIDNIAARYRTKKSFLDSFTSLHIFVLTLRCNQNCVYCQALSRKSDQKESDISFENLEKAVYLMFKSPSPHLTMEFQGGESSLTYERIKFAVELANKINENAQRQITFVLCTNCVELSDELLDFCEKYSIHISTSLDGPNWLHNKNRAKLDSYQNVIAGIAKVRERESLRNTISALMTTSWESIDYPKEIIDAYRENGFNNIFLRALNPYGLAVDSGKNDAYVDSFIEFYKKALDYIIELNLNGEYFAEGFTGLVLKKILTPFCIGFVDLQSPAGIINGVIVYYYDGYVYASDESRMLAENGDFRFRLGHVNDSYKDIFLGEKSMELAQVWANEVIAGCSDCAYNAYCGADPVRNYAIQGDIYGFRPTSSFCKKHKAIIEHIFSIIIERPEVLPIFKRWIND